MNELPQGWAQATTDALFTFVTSGSRGWARYYSDEGAPFIRVGNLRRASITPDLSDLQRVSPPLGAEGMRTQVAPDDILISITADLGRIALMTDVKETAYINQHVALARPVKAINPRYVAWYLSSDMTQRQWGEQQRGVTKLGLGLDDIRSVEIPIPPLAEQERIVAAIEVQFSRLDAGVAALERVRQNLRRIRAAVLEATVPSAEEQTTPKVPLGDLVAPGRKIAYGVLVPGDHDPDGIPFVRVGDLSNRQVRTQGLKYIAPAIAARYPRTRLKGGEVLLSLVGTIGRTAIVPPELAGANTARALAVISVQEAVEPRYVAIALSRDRVTRELTDLSHEVARKTLNLEDVRRYEIPLPSYSEQLEIVKAVETQEAWISSVEEVVARSFRRADHLRSSILQTAFSGRLVRQDESDEPVSDLFARIATEQASATGHRLAWSRKPQVLREEATA
jgi:type I restriction enzyme S subunit